MNGADVVLRFEMDGEIKVWLAVELSGARIFISVVGGVVKRSIRPNMSRKAQPNVR